MMNTVTKPGRLKRGTSKIDYIVLGNPDGVARLLSDYGYEPPQSLRELQGAVREFIQQEGQKGISDLVKLHPDRSAILATAPGGIAEMSLTAKNLQLGVPIVTAFHVARVVVLVLSIGPLFRLAQKWKGPAKT